MVKKHILFIVENNPVPGDLRVWNEAQAAKKFGYDASIICPKGKRAPSKFEEIDGIFIYRHSMPIEAARKLSFLLEYSNAIFWELLLAIRIYLKKPFHYIHSANPPDLVFLIAILFKLLGVKYIFDHHDICPENYLAKFNRKDILYRFLLIMEKLTFKTADMVISTNDSYRKIALERGKLDERNVIVVRNGPNLKNVIFKKTNAKWKNGFDYLVSYVGVIGNQEGVNNLLEAAEYIYHQQKVTNIKFIIIGTGPHLGYLVSMAKELSLEDCVQFTGYVPYEDFYEILSSSDICVNPEHRNSFTDRSTMLKIMDYMTFGKPIVMFRTTEGTVTAGEAAVYIEENDNVEFAESILALLDDEKKRAAMGKIGLQRIETKLSWDMQEKNLRKAYAYLEK